MTTTTIYKYNNVGHKNLSETHTTNSKGESIKTINKYPYELSSGVDETSASTIGNMISDHVINPVLKTETTLNDVVIDGSITNYIEKIHIDENSVTNSMYLPGVVKRFKQGSASDYEQRLEYMEYDNEGRLLQARGADGVLISFIWGYLGEYPVAKLENAPYASIPAATIDDIQAKSNLDDDHCQGTAGCNEALLRGALDGLRDVPALSDALITTYTYDPLVGVTSRTDPGGLTTYYAYDSYGRLIHVYDHQGHLVRKTVYNFKNE